jgi:hypothetical protein
LKITISSQLTAVKPPLPISNLGKLSSKVQKFTAMFLAKNSAPILKQHTPQVNVLSPKTAIKHAKIAV